MFISIYNEPLQGKIEKLVTAMGGLFHSKSSSDISFVIVKNVLAAKYKVSYLDSLFFENLKMLLCTNDSLLTRFNTLYLLLFLSIPC